MNIAYGSNQAELVPLLERNETICVLQRLSPNGCLQMFVDTFGHVSGHPAKRTPPSKRTNAWSYIYVASFIIF